MYDVYLYIKIPCSILLRTYLCKLVNLLTDVSFKYMSYKYFPLEISENVCMKHKVYSKSIMLINVNIKLKHNYKPC